LHGLGIKHSFFFFLFFFLKYRYKKEEAETKQHNRKPAAKNIVYMHVLGEAKETSAIFFQRLLSYFQFYTQGGASIQLLQFPFACYVLLLGNPI
jgi:hypothetical protein